MIQMVISDLDGTLLHSNQKFSSTDLDTLHFLQQQSVLRVIATGRSLASAYKVLPSNFPIDYLVFSSGAGVMDWAQQKLLLKRHFSLEQGRVIARCLQENHVDFMIHHPIPDNHQFHFYQTGKYNPDFERRRNLYYQTCFPLNNGSDIHFTPTQFVAIIPEGVEAFNQLKQALPEDLSIIRATSPLDGQTIWMEIFPETVNKAFGVEWLCRSISVQAAHTIGVGNDYNDTDFLHWVAHGYVVANAPAELQRQFITVNHFQENGFTHAVAQHFPQALHAQFFPEKSKKNA